MSSTYWQSEDDIAKQSYTIKLMKNTTVNQIKIEWKYPADTFGLSILQSSGEWEMVGMVKGNNEEINELKIAPTNILGAKITMEKFSKDKGKVGEALVYGIISIRLYADTKGVNLQKCSEFDKSKENQFLIEEYQYSDLKTGKDLMQEKATLIK